MRSLHLGSRYPEDEATDTSTYELECPTSEVQKLIERHLHKNSTDIVPEETGKHKPEAGNIAIGSGMPFFEFNADVGFSPFLICLLTEGNFSYYDIWSLSVDAMVESSRDKVYSVYC